MARKADTWVLAVIRCAQEGVTLDACLVFVPPGGDIDEAIRIGGEAGIPYPYLAAGIVLGDDFDPADNAVDEMFAYVG